MKSLKGNDSVKDLRKKQVELILLVLAFLSLIFISYTIYWERDYNKKFGYFEKIEAEVVNHNVVEGVEYDVLEYEVDSIIYHHVTSYKSKNHIEDKITIYYDKFEPAGVIYSLDIKRVLLPIISSLFVIFSIGVFIFYYFVFIKRNKPIIDTKIVEKRK